MKKSLIFLLFIMALMPFVSSLETTLKNEYKPGETIIFSVSGLLDNIEKKDVQFYSGRNFVSLIYDVAKINNDFYIYAILPNIERNYTLLIKNAKFFDIEEKTQDIAYNFSAKGNISSFSVNPGFVITNKDFSIKINSIKTGNIKASFLDKTQDYSLSYGEKYLEFSISSIKSSALFFLAITGDNSTKYSIPVYVLVDINDSAVNLSNPLSFSHIKENIFLLKNADFFYEIALYNKGLDDLDDISLLSSSKKLKLSSKISIPAGKNKMLNFTINLDENLSVAINATKGNFTASTTLNFIALKTLDEYRNLTANTTIKNNTGINQTRNGTASCTLCNDDEKCSGSLRLVDGELCCTGVCKAKKSSNNTLWIVVIVIALLIVGFFVYKKMKLKKDNSEEIIKKRNTDYEERFKPKIEQLKGGLTKA